jgi:hypothetical protein
MPGGCPLFAIQCIACKETFWSKEQATDYRKHVLAVHTLGQAMLLEKKEL